MKLTIFALVAALCLAGVSANAIGSEDLKYVPVTFAENVDIDNYSIFSSFYWIAKASLRTLKGANCTIKQVVAIKAAAQDFVDNIQACGSDATAAFKNVITAVQSVISTCNNIINLNDQVCNNDASTDGKTSTPFKCFIKLMGQMTTLYKQIKNTLSAIKKVPAVPADAAECTTTAVTNLTTVFTSFPTNVKTCSKLTSSQTFAEDTVDVETMNFLSTFYAIVKASLRTLKGVNCTIKEVIAVKTAAEDFIGHIESCGADAVAAFTDVIASVQSVISTSDNIINLNEKFCESDESSDGKTPLMCSIKLLGEMTTLYNDIEDTMTAITNVPSVPADAADCTNSAVDDLYSAFTSFPTNIETCSTLTRM